MVILSKLYQEVISSTALIRKGCRKTQKAMKSSKLANYKA
jgi:hypothetical protein